MKENLFEFLAGWPFWAQDIFLALSAIIVGLIIKGILAIVGKSYTKKNNEYSTIRSIIKHLGRPAEYFFPLLILNWAIPFMHFDDRTTTLLLKINGILLILAFAYLLMKLINVVQDYIIHQFDIKKTDNLRERKIRTQLQYLRKVIVFVIVVLAIIAILLSFESLRRIGAGLLTGVGVGGIIIGFAAQKSLGNLLAGLQIAFTQPLRIDDVVVVEGEWGRVEEITLTYVVINIWDKRRLILPITYFIEKPFQNWTRTTSSILGTASIFVDYAAPVDKIRTEFDRLIAAHPLWDKQAKALEVVNATDKVLELRCLMGANTSGDAWQMRCYIREHLVKYIQENHPEALPKVRASNMEAARDASFEGAGE